MPFRTESGPDKPKKIAQRNNNIINANAVIRSQIEAKKAVQKLSTVTTLRESVEAVVCLEPANGKAAVHGLHWLLLLSPLARIQNSDMEGA